MEYTVIIGGQSYDLPKKTISVMEELDKVLKVDSQKGMSIRDKYETLHRFVINMLGKDKAKEILGSDKITEIDMSELTIAVLSIRDSYDRPVEEYKTSDVSRRIERLPIEQMEGITKSMESLAAAGALKHA